MSKATEPRTRSARAQQCLSASLQPKRASQQPVQRSRNLSNLIAGILGLFFCLTPVSAEHIVSSEPIDLELAVVGGESVHHGPDDLQARIALRHAGDALHLTIEVVDDDLVFAEETERSDRIELVVAPPSNPYFDHPENYFHSNLLGIRYWFPNDQVDEVVAQGGWILDTSSLPNSCYGADDLRGVGSDALMERMPVLLGQVRYVFNPFVGRIEPHEQDPSGGLPAAHLAEQVRVKQLEVTPSGYRVELILPPHALGLVSRSGVTRLRLRVDVIDIDTNADIPVLASTSAHPLSRSPVHYESLRLEPAIPFQPHPQLAFIGTGLTPDRHQQALLKRVPPYFLWNGLEWIAARIGQRPGHERGHDMCSAGIGAALIAHEAELLTGPLEYLAFDLSNRQAAVMEGHLIVDGDPVYAPEGELHDVFALDSSTLALIDVYERPDRGRFSRGPCAGASTQYTDLVVVSETGTERHGLHSQSSCSTWPTINGAQEDQESEYLFNPPLDFDATTRTLTLTGSRFDHVWTLVQKDDTWQPRYQRVDKPPSAQSMSMRLAELSRQHEYGEIDTSTFLERFGAIVGKEGAHLVDRSLDQAVCEVARGPTPLELRLALSDFTGGVPDCMIPEWTRLPQSVHKDDPQATRLRTELDALLDRWKPRSDDAMRMAANYLVGGALLDDPDHTAVREIVWDSAHRMLRHVTAWEAPSRHTESMARSPLFSAVRIAVPKTWDLLLDWMDEERADRFVEVALAHYILQDDRERFDHLFARRELPPGSYHYLLMMGADRPAYATILLATGVAWTDRFSNGDTLLHHVASRRNAPAAWIPPLVAAGIDPNATDADGMTALQRLYREPIRGFQGDLENLRDKAHALIEAGAQLDRIDADGRSLLWHALEIESTHGQWKPGMVAGPLLEAGIGVERVDAAGTSALHRAIHLGIDWMVAPLLAKGADPNVTDAHGATPLMRSLFAAQTGVARQLMEANADLDARDRDGRTACDYIGLSLSGNPARLHALRRTFGCQSAGSHSWPALWPTSGDCKKPPIVFIAETEGHWNLHRIRPDGGDLQDLVVGNDRPIAWLRVAAGLGHVGYSDRGAARILACGATESIVLREDSNFLDWYPGNERVLIAGRNRSLCDLFVDGSIHCSGRSSGWPVDISPDGRKLVTNYSGHLPVIHDLVSRRTRELLDRDSVTTMEQNLQPRFLPDGKAISYIHRIDDNHWRLLAGIPGSAEFAVVLAGDSGLWKYAWSPDGESVVYANGPAATADLIVHDRKTGQRRTLALERPIIAIDWMWPDQSAR